VSLTVVILTRNEEEFIENAVGSALLLTANVIVLDSGSDDMTRTIAAQAGATVHQRLFDGFASQRQAALDLVATDWTLFLDADERLTGGLVTEIQRAVADADDSTGGYWIPRRNLAFGHILKGGGWWPDYQLRLLRTQGTTYATSREVHEVASVDGATFSLTQPMMHINYRSRLEFVRKQWEYTAPSINPASPHRPRRRSYISSPAREFWSRFVELHGYRDRQTGLFMAVTMALASFRLVWLQRRFQRADGTSS
jgi:glycosyltransferase involved in cell wall biosynthesis